ncbi:MAG: hypothetical protein V2I50_10885, partial [Desulfuromusa sp.]|nr:hypothetical protein [Desulfuromusa sp.]
MAILIEGLSVVIKAQAVIAKFPGGWPAFEASSPNETLCADNELVRVGFMTPDDVKLFVDTLSDHGIQYLSQGKSDDLVIVDQQKGFCAPCDWAEFGQVDLAGHPEKKISACRLIGSNQPQIVLPDGWLYESSLSANYKFVESDQVAEEMEFIRHDNGVDVYRDRSSGKEKYVGRVTNQVKVSALSVEIPQGTDPLKLEACRSFARMMNTLDVSHLIPWLADDMTYSSQWVFESIQGKEAYVDYITAKLETVRKSNSQVWAEIAHT